MKLFHAHGSCSLGIRILLEEIGAPYALQEIKLAESQQRSAAYLAQNPKGKVPALMRPDGEVLTEYPVISLWLAREFPQARLLPEAEEETWRALELVEYVVSSLHMRGVTLAMRPDKFISDPAARAELAAHGRDVLREGFDRLETRLGGRPFFFGHFTIVDAAVFYLLNWQPRLGLDLPTGLRAYYAEIATRPAVQRALQKPDAT